MGMSAELCLKATSEADIGLSHVISDCFYIGLGEKEA